MNIFVSMFMNIFVPMFMNIFVTNATQSVNWVGTGCPGFPSLATTGTLTPPRPSSLHSTMLPASHLNANLCHASRCSALQCIAYKTLDTGKVMQINGNPAFPAFNNVVSLTSECKLNAIQCNLL